MPAVSPGDQPDALTTALRTFTGIITGEVMRRYPLARLEWRTLPSGLRVRITRARESDSAWTWQGEDTFANITYDSQGAAIAFVNGFFLSVEAP
jgi:hypothetical protein